MKKNRISKILAFALFLLSGFNIACEDTMLNNMVDDRVYLLKTGFQEINVYNFEPSVAQVLAVKSGVSQRSAQLRLSVKPEVLQRYNDANGTNYKLIDPSIYSLSNPQLDFGTNDFKKSFDFVIDDVKLKALQAQDPESIFVIPCEVTNPNPGPEDSVSMETLIKPSLIEPYIEFTNSGFLTELNNITASSLPEISFMNKIQINYPNDTDINFVLGIPANANALIAQYNADLNLLPADRYQALPEGAYEFQTTGKIAKGVDYSSFFVKLIKDKLKVGNGRFVLPLSIKEVSKNKIHPTNSLVLIPFYYHE